MYSTPNPDKNVRFVSPPVSAISNSSTMYSLLERGERPLSGSLKKEIDEKQRIEKENFDLKMKIYYLEESIKNLTEGVISSDQDDLRAENALLRTQIEENGLNIEQRNTLLVKAKGAIESLKGESFFYPSHKIN
jgi:hypothetical protein